MSIVGLRIEYQLGGRPEPDALRRIGVAFERAGEDFARFGEFVFPKLAPLLEREMQGQFDAEGQGPDAGGWAPLSSRYAAQKAKKFPGRPLLVRRGALRRALTRSGATNSRREYTATTFRFGTAGIPYASFHQTGTGRMPARPPIDLTEAFEKELRTAAMDSARDVVKRQPDLPPLTGT